ERNREIEEGVFKATDDPRHPLVAPHIETVPPHLNFAPLENAVETVNRSAAEYRKAFDQTNANGGALAPSALAEVNKLLIESERKLTNAEGLPNRPWFKHQLYAPGFYTGYAVKTVPAVREAIELKQWKQADEAIVVVARVLENEAALISSAAQKLAAAKEDCPETKGLAGTSAVRNRTLRDRKDRRYTVSVANIKEHTFGSFAGHFARLQIYYEQGLSPFNFVRIGAFLFDARENRAGVIAEIYGELHQFIRTRDLFYTFDSADANV